MSVDLRASVLGAFVAFCCFGIVAQAEMRASGWSLDLGGFEEQVKEYEWQALKKIEDFNLKAVRCGADENCRILMYEKSYHAYANIIISRISQRDDKAAASAMFRQFDTSRMLFVKMKRACDRNFLGIPFRDNGCYIEAMQEIQDILHEMFVTELRLVSLSRVLPQ